MKITPRLITTRFFGFTMMDDDFHSFSQDRLFVCAEHV
jgi:hypothetical protein